jgi:2-polyprenyl-3-methyl-5-hydroxy-6-metoxy-1,4-benzoquinol methylase
MPDEVYRDYGWAESRTRAHDYLLADILKTFEGMNIPRQAKILDAGCGGGYIFSKLQEKGYENIWGIDPSISGVEVARKESGKTAFRLAVHNAYELLLPPSFPQHGYDVVLSVEVLEHLYSPSRYLQNICWWLKKGGCLILTTPYHGYLKNLAIALLNKADSHLNPLWEGGHIKFFSRISLFKLMEEAGIEPVSFRGSGRLPLLWKSMIVSGKK